MTEASISDKKKSSHMNEVIDTNYAEDEKKEHTLARK